MMNQFVDYNSFRQRIRYTELRSVFQPVAQLSDSCLCGARQSCCGCGCGCGCSCNPCAPKPCCPAPCPPCPAYFTVTFDANGGVPVPAPQMVPYGGLLARPADPVRAGYTFAGWYPVSGFSVGPWNFDTDVVTGNLVLVAQWQPLFYTVTFNANGGAPTPPAQTVAYGQTVTRPADPIREDYLFVAWYRTPDFSGLPWSFATDLVTGSITLYARWLQPV